MFFLKNLLINEKQTQSNRNSDIMKRLCLGYVPVHFFFMVIPIRKSLNTIALATIMIFSWRFFFTLIVLGTVTGLRYQQKMQYDLALASMLLNMTADLAMVYVAFLLAWKEAHLVYMAWAAMAFTIQLCSLGIGTLLDIKELDHKYLLPFTSARVLAGLDFYFSWILFFFTWIIALYLCVAVFASYQISRLPSHYDEIVDARMKSEYEKERERIANKVFNEAVNECYLEKLNL